MPVATQAALRGVDLSLAASLDYQVLLANTYHLLLRPGAEVFRHFGGIHRFMNWDGAVLTDSGGFQIFSLSRQLRIDDTGAVFRSYVDGRKISLAPESSIAMQAVIGSDIMMVLDQCIDSRSEKKHALEALQRTTAWAKRSLAARAPDSTQALFGIVQGACYADLRRQSADAITALPFDGFAIGGLAVGETKQEREDISELTASLLPEDKPRYLMGVGTPIDLLEAVKRGIDMFDCIIPTSFAQQGIVFTSEGKIDLFRTRYRTSEEAPDKNCDCLTCRQYTRGYLHHLSRAREFVLGHLLSIHNLAFYRKIMSEMRESIISGSFRAYYEAKRPALEASDTPNPGQPTKQREQSLSLGDYEVLVHHAGNGPAGYGSIRQKSSGEIMHSVNNPVDEAMSLYVMQPGIADELQKQESSPLVIWDVGLGAATNAMTCISLVEKSENLFRPLHIESFETDTDSLQLALKYPNFFTHIRHAAPSRLLQDGIWKNSTGSITWRLFHGKCQEKYCGALPPDIIWYDHFSCNAEPEHWTISAFKTLLSFCEGRTARLYTYSTSTAVRAGLLAAGWYVAAGQGSGPKSTTTAAYTPEAVRKYNPQNLLARDWLARWERSDARIPYGETENFSLDLVRGHGQFL